MKPNPTRKKTRPVNASAPRPNIYPLEDFVQAFRDSVLQDIRYCFILGSGASITSKVDSGAILVDRWLVEMFDARYPGAGTIGLEAWANATFRHLPGFTWATRAQYYGHIYVARFPDNANGQAWLRKLMEGKQPAFGYSVLARILSETPHKLVITTNFDNLVQDALVSLGQPRAFIAHSPEDARFLANHEGKARIVKLHGDIDRETYNADSLLSALAEPWVEPLRQLLGSYTPIFLGYSGSDPGLMSFLNDVYIASDARPRPVWAYRVDANVLRGAAPAPHDPPGRPDTPFLRTFMEKQRAWWLPTPGFDELMLLLGHALRYSHGGREIENYAKRGMDTYKETLTTALRAARTHEGAKWCIPLDEMTRHAEQALLGEVKRRRWSEWLEYIKGNVGPSEEIDRCREAIVELPSDPRARARLAWALGKFDPKSSEPETVLAKAETLVAGRYEAESDEALSVRLTRANLWNLQGKHRQAERVCREMLDIHGQILGPEHLTMLAIRNSLAIALDDLKKPKEAEAQHRMVLEVRERVLGPHHPDTLMSRNNLASALDAQEKYAEAEAEHRAVLSIRQRVLGPEHPDTLMSRSNLATALYAQDKYAAAVAEHRARIPVEVRVLGTNHPDVLMSCYNLALALQAQGQNKGALKFAVRARDGWRSVLGDEHTDFKDAKKLCDQIAAAIKPGKPLRKSKK